MGIGNSNDSRPREFPLWEFQVTTNKPAFAAFFSCSAAPLGGVEKIVFFILKRNLGPLACTSHLVLMPMTDEGALIRPGL